MKNNLSHIVSLPEYRALLAHRRGMMLPFILLMLAGYYGFILLIAFDPALLSTKVGEGVSTLGIWLGLGLILLTFVVTVLYVVLTNGKTETLIDRIQAIHKNKVI